MNRWRLPRDDDAATAWLRAHAEPGDLLLLGGGSLVSFLIKTLTGSSYCHSAIVVEGEAVIEAYDYRLTPHDGDEGPYRTSFDRVVSRCPLRHLTLLRPEGLDVTALLTSANGVLASGAQLPFPTVGAAALGLLVTSHRIAGRRIQELADNREMVERTLLSALDFIGDGIRRAHCAELSARLYDDAGLALQFHEPALWPYIKGLSDASNDRRVGEVLCLRRATRVSLTAARTGRHRFQSPHCQVERSGDATDPTVDASWTVSEMVTAVVQLAETVSQRRREGTPPEPSDFLLPADFLQAEPFTSIGSIKLGRHGWQPHADRPRRGVAR